MPTCEVEVGLLLQAPALSAAVPSTTRQLWRFGFSSSSSQSQDSKAEAAAQAVAEAAAGGAAAGSDQAQQEQQEQQPQPQLFAEELQKANEELQAQLEEERKKVGVCCAAWSCATDCVAV